MCSRQNGEECHKSFEDAGKAREKKRVTQNFVPHEIHHKYIFRRHSADTEQGKFT